MAVSQNLARLRSLLQNYASRQGSKDIGSSQATLSRRERIRELPKVWVTPRRRRKQDDDRT